jgi:hypothetical protein
MEQTLEQKVMAWCVTYVRDLIKDDEDGFMVEMIQESIQASEFELLSAMESLVPEEE